MRICLLDEQIQGQPKLKLTLITINAKKGLLQSVKNPVPLLRLMSVKTTRVVTVLVAVMNLRSVPYQTTSNNSSIKELNRDIKL